MCYVGRMGEDPNILVVLTSVRSDFEAQTIAEAVRAHGIPAEVFGTAARVAQWELGMSNEIQVMVRRCDLEAASMVLRGIKAESVDIDWNEVDVGQPVDETARCIASGASNDRPGKTTAVRRLIPWSLIAAGGLAGITYSWEVGIIAVVVGVLCAVMAPARVPAVANAGSGPGSL